MMIYLFIADLFLNGLKTTSKHREKMYQDKLSLNQNSGKGKNKGIKVIWSQE